MQTTNIWKIMIKKTSKYIMYLDANNLYGGLFTKWWI